MSRAPRDLEQAAAATERLDNGLAQARARTGDELMRRRLWTRLAAPGGPSSPHPRHRSVRWPVLALAGVGVVATLAMSVVIDRDPPALTQAPAPAATTPTPTHSAHRFLPAPAEVRTGPDETLTFNLAGGAQVALAGRSHLDLPLDDQPVVRAGRVTLQVPKQAPGRSFAVLAGPYRVKVVGTRFAVAVSREQIGVTVDEGVVEVWRDDRAVRLVAGQSWTGPVVSETAAAPRATERRPAAPVRRRATDVGGVRLADALAVPAQVTVTPAEAPAPLATVAAPAPTRAPPVEASQLSREAREALNAGDPARALALLELLIERGGAAGENALYETGRVLRDHMLRPRQALQVWERYRRQFPRGLLRPEVDISIFETLARSGERDRARSEAESFVVRHPHSERRAEVEAWLKAQGR